MIDVVTDVGVLAYPEDQAVLPVMRSEATWEPDEREALLRAIGSNDHFVDVGAHVGYFTVLAAKMARTVTAFEPNSTNFACLRQNVAGLQNVEIRRAAVGMSKGKVTLNLSPDNSGDHRVGPHPESEASEEVDMVQLAMLPSVDVLKVDAQGLELEVLESLGGMRPRVIVAEAWPEGGVTEEMLADWGRSCGYVTNRLTDTDRGYYSVVMRFS